jgi:hypothetical protein
VNLRHLPPLREDFGFSPLGFNPYRMVFGCAQRVRHPRVPGEIFRLWIAKTMIAFEQARLAEPPLDLQTFAVQLAAYDEQDPTGKRASERFQMATLVPAIRIDEQLEPVGEPFLVMTRNISTSGIALVHTQPIKEGRIAIELTGASGERIQLALQILRCRELDRFYELGCRYLRRLGTFTS